MSKANTKNRRFPAARRAEKGLRETRIDPAHRTSLPEPVEADTPAIDAAKTAPLSEAADERLRVQARQLAARLRERENALDHRQAELNAQIAQYERDLRTARLWIAEREAELEQRDEDLQRQAEVLAQNDAEIRRQAEDSHRQETELARKAQQLEKGNEQLARRIREFDLRRREADRRQAELEYRERGMETQAAATAAANESAQERTARQATEAAAAIAAADSRNHQLAEAEARLSEALDETRSLNRQLAEAREEAARKLRQQQDRLAAERQATLNELVKQRRAVQRRSEHVDRQRQALEQLREELGQVHRATLELRLATEELWSGLSGCSPPAALAQSIARIRGQLTDHYRLADTDLQRQKAELDAIRGKLAKQHETLATQRRRFEQWVAEKQEGSQKEAARLVAQEEQLREAKTRLADEAHRWQAERIEYQAEIERLRRQLGTQVPLNEAQKERLGTTLDAPTVTD